MSTIERFTAADDLLHDIGTAPHVRESYFFVLPLPSEGIAAMVYAWRTGATGQFGRLVAIGGEDIGAPQVFDIVDGVDLVGDDLDDCEIAGLHIRHPEPLRRASLSFSSDAVTLDVTVEGLHRPVSWHENPDGCPAWAATDRYEQSVRTSGTLRVDGREIAIDGIGHRDHSWGPREWGVIQHWKWMNAATPDGSVSLHAWESSALGARHRLGYVNRGGEIAVITDLRVESSLDDALVHRSLTATILDETGRETVFTAAYRAGVALPFSGLLLYENAMDATIDGAPAIAHVEHGWPQPYVEQLRR
ncbi:DUF7064 domain-containing protein [Paraconexibacter algicola]|uniref:DUF7064 domain-containing protein n=2 Tax=Solirubrobacterales TaxID=588673 RepID=UPI0011B28C65|nr:hypothetical protein [Paraconexibacter algicola]